MIYLSVRPVSIKVGKFAWMNVKDANGLKIDNDHK